MSCLLEVSQSDFLVYHILMVVFVTKFSVTKCIYKFWQVNIPILYGVNCARGSISIFYLTRNKIYRPKQKYCKKGNIFGSFLWSMNLHIHIEDVTNATTWEVRKHKTFVI